MPERRQPILVDPQTDTLVRAAADRAVQLALAGAEEAQKLAVDRAVRETNMERDLREHEAHLQRINGSQRKMADALAMVQALLEKMTAAADATAKAVAEQASRQFSRRTIIVGLLGALAGYGGILATVLLANRTF